jgi:zinc D-Ala-D-Ala carboxypeptidase
VNWALYPNFTENEFRCRHCGVVAMQSDFMTKLQQLRTVYGRPMTITSGYRCPQHPAEINKTTTGAHTTGRAADIAVSGADAHDIIRLATHLGFAGIGVQQKGTGRFIHIDTVGDTPQQPRPTVWSY